MVSYKIQPLKYKDFIIYMSHNFLTISVHVKEDPGSVQKRSVLVHVLHGEKDISKALMKNILTLLETVNIFWPKEISQLQTAFLLS